MAAKDEPNRVLIEEIAWQIGKHVEDVKDVEQRENAARAILRYLRVPEQQAAAPLREGYARKGGRNQLDENAERPAPPPAFKPSR